MSTRKTRKEAYNLIVKENKNHQEAFNELRAKKNKNLDVLAEEVSKIPSKAKMNEYKPLIFIFISLLVIIAILRAIGLYVISYGQNFNFNIIILFVLIGLLAPAIGIIGIILRKVELINSVGILFVIGILRSFSKQEFNTEPITLMVLGLYIAAIILAYYIPFKLKTKFKKSFDKEIIDGVERTVFNYKFEDSNPLSEDILDNTVM